MSISGSRFFGLASFSAVLVVLIGVGVHWFAKVEAPPRDDRSVIIAELDLALASALISQQGEEVKRLEPQETPEPPLDPEPATVTIAGGPLAQAGWSYAWSALNKQQPGESFVLLRRDGFSERKVPGQRPAEFTFWLRETRIQNKEYALDFVVVSADAKKLVYFEPSFPHRHYNLERPSQSLFRVREN